MRIYDISQELLGCVVFPGDPAPRAESLSSMEEGKLYNLTALSMCAHNGTHVDAPFHFYRDGVTVDRLPLSKMVGEAYVAEHQGMITAEDAEWILVEARLAGKEAAKRILIKGNATLSLEAAKVLSRAELELFGNESQTVGPEDAPMETHLHLLGQGVVLLEGIRLGEVPSGKYLLNAAPISVAGADGAPCRAILISDL